MQEKSTRKTVNGLFVNRNRTFANFNNKLLSNNETHTYEHFLTEAIRKNYYQPVTEYEQCQMSVGKRVKF